MSDPGQRLFTADEFKALPVPETNFYFEPYIPTEGVTLMFGKPGAYKSTVMFAMANAIATGDKLWGVKPDRQCRVLMIQLDMPLAVTKTRFAPALSDGAPIDIFLHNGTIDLVGHKTQFESDVWAELRAAHERHPYGFVIFDVLRRMHTLDDKLSENVAPVYGAGQQLFPGASLAFLHHTRKSGKDDTPEMDAESFAGSLQWAAQAQVVIQVKLHDADRGLTDLRVVRSQVAERVPSLRLEVNGWRVEREGEARINEVGDALGMVDGCLRGRDLDAALARIIGCSAVTARRRRLEWEKQHSSGFGSVVPFPSDPAEHVENKG